MAWHPERTEHTYFCPKCKEEFERSQPGKCDECGLSLVPAGYCGKCGGYWRRRVGELCPEHGEPLEGEAAEDLQDLDASARAEDPGLDAHIVYAGDEVTCAQAQAALEDAGLEAELVTSGPDVLSPAMRSSEGACRVIVARRDLARARAVIRDFEQNLGESSEEA
jgi:hypothetical protein